MDRRTAVIFGICAAPRLVAMAMWPSPAPTAYDELATGLLTSGTFGFDGVPSTYMEPLYPAFLAAALFVTGGWAPAVTLLQVAVAAIGGVLLYRLAALLAGPRAGVWTAVIFAFYPYLLRQSVARLEITVCATLAIAATLALARTERLRGAIGTGALFGLLMLTRTSFVVAAVGAALWLAWRGGRRLALAMLLAALAVEVPWLARNVRIDGSPLPSRVGENLYLSTSAYAAGVPLHDVDLLLPLALAEVGVEVARLDLSPVLERRAVDDAMLTRAVAFVGEHPGRVLRLKARNALYLWSPQLLPRERKSPAELAMMDGEELRTVNPARPWLEDGSHAVAQGVLLVLAGVGLARRRLSAGDVPLLILLGAQAAVCIAFFPTTRLMAPVMYVVMFYAAVGLTNSSAAAPRRR
jgi:4-amino-4-deoxy-L-arabinose transferase-like glycosyltransferase